jgi:hypothetical protein
VAQNDVEPITQKAFDIYEKHLKRGQTDRTFDQWWPLNYPQLGSAIAVVDAAQARHLSAVADMDGPIAGQWKADVTRMSHALMDKDTPG